MNLTQLLDATDRAGITFKTAPGGQLRVAPAGAITPDIAASIRRHKPTLLALHRGGPDGRGVMLMRMFLAGELEHEDLGMEEPPPEPCPKCGSLEKWWDAVGGDHFEYCDPPEASRRLRRHARQVRAKERSTKTPDAREAI